MPDRNNFKSLIEKGLSSENAIKESLARIKNHSTQIAFLDQNLTTMCGYKTYINLNNTDVCINFPTVLYGCALEHHNSLEDVTTKSDFYKMNLPLVQKNIAESAFLVIRIKNIDQLLLTAQLLHGYAVNGKFQLPPAIIVCSKDQLNDVQNNLNNIPIPVTGITTLNFDPELGLKRDLNYNDIQKLFYQNNDIQQIFKKNQFNTTQSISFAKSISAIFTKHPYISGAIGTASAAALVYLNMSK